ncbi:MAG TPA: agmatine deiminase family protein [Pirellulales bacterium]|jgi:agmatine deiminase|nr:agmatine deiminase family protein [Pirellulales bacterium]
MPAEWEPHEATWLSWPHNQNSWPGNFEPIPAVWAELTRVLAEHETVHICAGGERVMAEARRMVGDVPNVVLHDIETNDAWMRDHGPMFLVGPKGSPPTLLDWGYNAWGGKYPPFDKDDLVPRQAAEILGYRRIEPGIILEGGAVDFNGKGAVLTTEQCLLNPNRNPQLDRAAIERYLAEYCGAPHVVWLGEGIVGDDTDGHIDELARFVAPGIVLAAVEDDPADENYQPLQDNFARLEAATDQDGRGLEVIALPMPRPLFYGDQRMPGSYCNFYISNGVVVAPQFDDPADAQVLEILRSVFPDRRVVGLRARELAWGLGAFHCITQQQPALSG